MSTLVAASMVITYVCLGLAAGAVVLALVLRWVRRVREHCQSPILDDVTTDPRFVAWQDAARSDWGDWKTTVTDRIEVAGYEPEERS